MKLIADFQYYKDAKNEAKRYFPFGSTIYETMIGPQNYVYYTDNDKYEMWVFQTTLYKTEGNKLVKETVWRLVYCPPGSYIAPTIPEEEEIQRMLQEIELDEEELILY